MKILFTGGGTGGHIFPIIAIIRELNYISRLENKNRLEFYFVGPKSELGTQSLKNEGVIIKTILAGKFRRYLTLRSIPQNIVDLLFKTPIGLLQALWYVRKISPHLIFSKGGYGAMPVIFAAQMFKIPMVLHESDIIPGRATKIASPLAREIFISFPTTDTSQLAAKKIHLTGNPIRKEILGGQRVEAKRIFGLQDKKPILLVWGGSQGAKRINNLILAILPQLLPNFEIIHQCGSKEAKEIEGTAVAIIEDDELLKDYHSIDFLTEEELKHAFAAAHLVISRAGSTSIFEIAAVGKPCILLPLPEAAQNHQAENANAYAANGAAVIMESKNPTPAMLYSKIMSIFSQPEKLKQMSQAALAFAKPDAAELIAKHLAQYFASPSLKKE